MKKLLLFLTTTMIILLFNGCGSVIYYDDTEYYNDFANDNLTTLFLVDEQGFSYANIPYRCDSMTRWSKTAPNGEFSFVQPDKCEFDFNGLDGIYGNNFDDIVRVVDYHSHGKGDVPYQCSSFGASSTYYDGSFDYDQNDRCVFYL